MDDAVMLESSPTMFDELPKILARSDCKFALLSTDSVLRGIRRFDTACYSVTQGQAVIGVWTERRLGNPTMCISVVPQRKSIWRRDAAADKLAQWVVELLVAHGANME